LRDKEFTCTKHGTTSLGGRCKTCPTFKRNLRGGILAPVRVIRFDKKHLFPELPGDRMNPSILPSGDGYLYTWRTTWTRADTWIVRLDGDFKPVGYPKRLDLHIPHAASVTREDARLFRHHGKVHVAFTGASRHGRRYRTNCCFVRLNERTLATECKFYPHYPKRGEWFEKNWQFWEWRDQLYAAYTISPHKVLKIECDKASMAYETPLDVGLYAGEMLRGGTPPVLHNSEWYSFFHGYTYHGNRRLYNYGCYTFSDEPPFRVKRLTRQPLDVANLHDNPKGGESSFVVFPCGAFFKDGQWVLSVGIHDVFGEIRFYDAAEVEKRLTKV
jgi:predicted GH43/DUF377 family glycosyl hydrolase